MAAMQPLALFEAHKHLGFRVALRLRSRYRKCTLAELENAALLGIWQAALQTHRVPFVAAARHRARLAVWEYAVGWSRRRGRRQAAVLHPLKREPACQDQRQREIVEARDQCQALLCRLDGNERRVLAGYYLEGLTLAEMGRCEGVTVQAMSHRLKTALAHARELVREGA